MTFSDHAAGVDDAVAEHLGEEAWLYRGGAGAAVETRGWVERPGATHVLGIGPGVDRTRPVLFLPVGGAFGVARLAERDEAICEGRRWRVAGAPRRPDDGRWFVADVEDLGAAA